MHSSLGNRVRLCLKKKKERKEKLTKWSTTREDRIPPQSVVQDVVALLVSLLECCILGPTLMLLN